MQAASQIPSTAAEQPQMPALIRHASGAYQLSGYTIKRGIGAGGFGEVYYATSDAGKDVALKLIRPQSGRRARGVRQCLTSSTRTCSRCTNVRQDEQGTVG